MSDDMNQGPLREALLSQLRDILSKLRNEQIEELITRAKTLACREDEIYWVRDHRSPHTWTIARWDAAQAWWVLAWVAVGDPAGPSGVCSESRFVEIGPRVAEPFAFPFKKPLERKAEK